MAGRSIQRPRRNECAPARIAVLPTPPFIDHDNAVAILTGFHSSAGIPRPCTRHSRVTIFADEEAIACLPNDTAVQRRTGEGAQRPTRSSDCNGLDAGPLVPAMPISDAADVGPVSGHDGTVALEIEEHNSLPIGRYAI